MAWNKGLYIAQLHEDEIKAGGCWFLGDQPYPLDPNYPGKNAGHIKAKLWYANPEKYQPGHYKLKNRSKTGEWEYVRVAIGELELVTENCTYSLRAMDEGVDIPPYIDHGWQLREKINFAAGITILRQLDAPALQPGQGNGYQISWWKQDSNNCPLQFDPTFVPDWQWQVLVSFGPAPIIHQSKTSYTLENSLAFIPRPERSHWNLITKDSPGLSIFF